MRVSRFVALSLTWVLALTAALAAWAASDEGLREELEALYRVAPAPAGVELSPRESRWGVETITVSGDRARINGAPVNDEVMRAWLGEEATLIRRLLDLPPAERRSLFGLPTGDLEGDDRGERRILEAPQEGGPRDEVPERPELSEVPEPPEPPEAPEIAESPWPERGHRTGDQFNLFNDLDIGPEESAREAVAVFGSVRVTGEVRGDVTAVMGSVFVEGRVGGEVVAVNGSVHLGPKAEVLKGVTAVGGTVERAPGATVRGVVTEVPYWGGSARWDHPWPDRGPRWWRFWFHPPGSPWGLFWELFKLACLALLLAITVLVAPRAVERASRVVEAEWWKAGLVGLLAEILFIPVLVLVFVLLAITVVGCILIIPLALVLPFFLICVFLLAYAAPAVCLGRLLSARLGSGWTSPYAHLLLGMVVLEGMGLFGELAHLAGGWAWPPALLFGVLGEIITFAAMTIGFGALLLARSRRSEMPLAPPAAPSPLPEPTPPGPLPAIAVPPMEPPAERGDNP
jgi:hypothetical protein